MRILVIEDEIKTSQSLKKGLAEHGFFVDIASDGESGLSLALTRPYDLIVLDIMLPQRDGWSVLKEIRRTDRDVLCLVLTAQDAIPDKVKGLDLGADAYMVKPFAFSELLAQIRSLMRRDRMSKAAVVRVADLEIDLMRRKAIRGGRSLDLTSKEFALLSLLVRHLGDIVSRSIIAEEVWGVKHDTGTNVVDVQIRRLRSKVDDGFDTKLIHTVRGVGYVVRKEE